MKKKDDKVFDMDEFFDMFDINAISDFLLGKPKAIKGISDLSMQKKGSRLVINLPEWLKALLKRKAEQEGLSMNETVRVALIEYLTKEENK